MFMEELHDWQSTGNIILVNKPRGKRRDEFGDFLIGQDITNGRTI